MATMRRIKRAPDVRVVELSREEAHKALDRQARRSLNMSGEEFLRHWDANDFDPELIDTPGFRRVEMIRGFGR